MTRPKDPAPFTDEDQIAWVHALERCVSIPMLYFVSLESDRRDAQLMLGAQLQPRCVVHWRNGLDHLILLRGPPTGERLEWLE